MLRIGQSADVIATQTPKNASSGVAPTPPTPSQKRIITEAEILGIQTAKGPTPRKKPTDIRPAATRNPNSKISSFRSTIYSTTT